MSRTTNCTQSKVILAHMHSVEQQNYGVNGGPRWQVEVCLADGTIISLRTACGSSSAYSCNLNSANTDTVIRLTMHQIASGHWIAENWDCEGGIHYRAEFDAERERVLLDKTLSRAAHSDAHQEKGGAL